MKKKKQHSHELWVELWLRVKLGSAAGTGKHMDTQKMFLSLFFLTFSFDSLYTGPRAAAASRHSGSLLFGINKDLPSACLNKQTPQNLNFICSSDRPAEMLEAGSDRLRTDVHFGSSEAFLSRHLREIQYWPQVCGLFVFLNFIPCGFVLSPLSKQIFF